MRLAPETSRAAWFEWQLFVTLTWGKNPPRSALRRERALRLYLRLLARKAQVPYERLDWFAREEHGEQFGRAHFHVLIAGLPFSSITFDFGVVVGQLWSHGWCEARRWVQGLGALEYSGEEGANCYEGGKYRAGLPITLSESLKGRWNPLRATSVEREDPEHSDNPEGDSSAVCGDAGRFQRELGLTSMVAEAGGYLLAAKASRTHVELITQAAITGAL